MHKNTVVIIVMSADRNSGFCIIYHWYIPISTNGKNVAQKAQTKLGYANKVTKGL